MNPETVCKLAERNHGLRITDAEREHLAYGYTGFPCFWHIPREGRNAAECFWRQYNRVLRRIVQGHPIGDGVRVPYPGRRERKGDPEC